MIFNPIYFLATAALGWGFSLSIYRPLARHNGWPMGAMQTRHPFFVVLLGLAGLVLSFLYILGDPAQRWPILLLGLLLSLFWTGFLRVASQWSLILAPTAALLLGVTWAGTEDGARELKTLDDKLVDRAIILEKRIEDRLRTTLQKRSGSQGSNTEELAPTPTPPIIRPATKTP